VRPPDRTARGLAVVVAFALVVSAFVVSAFGVGAAVAADAAVGEATRPPRELATLTARASVLGQQAAAARAAVRWRLGALRRLVHGGELDGATRARAVDAGTRALARELAEARGLERERADTAAEAEALASVARAPETIGAPPGVAAPVVGPVVARFGVAPDRATGLLVARPGVRIAAAPRAPVHAPFAGRVASVATEPEGAAVVLEDGAGWTAIVGGLAEAEVAEGQPVAAGDRLGAAAEGGPSAPPVVSLEVWRGRHPVDPLLFLKAPAPPSSAVVRLADAPRLP
jgi:septal ring factor EnvC (AmiA/AmiB activator)